MMKIAKAKDWSLPFLQALRFVYQDELQERVVKVDEFSCNSFEFLLSSCQYPFAEKLLKRLWTMCKNCLRRWFSFTCAGLPSDCLPEDLENILTFKV